MTELYKNLESKNFWYKKYLACTEAFLLAGFVCAIAAIMVLMIGRGRSQAEEKEGAEQGVEDLDRPRRLGGVRVLHEPVVEVVRDRPMLGEQSRSRDDLVRGRAYLFWSVFPSHVSV